MADHYSIWKLKDFSREDSSVKMYNGAITPVSLPGFLTEFGQMRTAIDDITLGTVVEETWVGDKTDISNIAPTNVFAQREMKWLVTYEDDVSKNVHYLTIPTADPTGRLIAGTDKANLAEAAMAAFVTRFNSFARSPESDQNTVTLLDVELVGRNL